MAKSLSRALMKVNHVQVANFKLANMSFNAIRENKILAKISEFTVHVLHIQSGPYSFIFRKKSDKILLNA